MTDLMLIFVVLFVLVVAAGCGLLVLRMLGSMELPESPPFPRRREHGRWHGRHAKARVAEARAEELVKR